LAAWVWPSATGTFAALSLVLAAFLITPDAPAGPQIVYAPQPAPPQPPAADPGSPTGAVVKTKERSSEDLTETAALLRQKRDVLRWGVDMLPESKPTAGDRPSADVTAREVTHWLSLPPGTFALPATQPKKPAPKDEDEE